MLRRVDEDVPPQVGEPPFEGGGVVEDLDDPELPAVVEAAGERVAVGVPPAARCRLPGRGAPCGGGGVVEALDDPDLPPVVEPAGDRVALRVPLATLLFVRGLGA